MMSFIVRFAILAVALNALVLTSLAANAWHGSWTGNQAGVDQVVDTAKKVIDDVRLSLAETDKCTAIAVGKRAGTQGSMTTHTADCADCDFRINKVPARDHEEGATRPLYLYKGSYPATITSDRGVTWHPDNLEGSKEQLAAWGTESVITGRIPEVPHSYAIFEAGYGIMNEHQVAIGESTCAARFWAAPTSAGGKAQIETREMSKIALERTTTARDAIKLMGHLATTLGFYAADWSGGDLSLGEGGEGLTVIDKNEAWVFHVLADDTGTSAIWAAQRLPEDHVAVIANQFIIRDIVVGSPDFEYSDNIFDVAARHNLWDPSSGKPLDFLKTYAPPRAHSPYATRRVWRVFNIVAPSIVLPGNTDPYGTDYPFSIKVDRAITPQELMNINRDHYEGTEFDLTKGIAAGPFGEPNRFDMAPQPKDNLTFIDVLQGSYERAISLFRTSYSFVAVSREQVPDVLSLLWFSQYAPSSSSYAPFYVTADKLPEAYTKGSLFKYDPSVSFWNFLAAGNWASRFYSHAMQDVFALQRRIEQDTAAAATVMENTVMQMGLANKNQGSSKAAVDMITQFTETQGNMIVRAWRDLLPQLITNFHDGYHVMDKDTPKIRMVRIFYPKWWLDLTGYFLNHVNTGPDTIMFEANPSSITGSFLFFSILVTACVSLFAGMRLGKQGLKVTNPLKSANHSYEMIDQADREDATSGLSSGKAYSIPSGNKREGYNSI